MLFTLLELGGRNLKLSALLYSFYTQNTEKCQNGQVTCPELSDKARGRGGRKGILTPYS